MRTTLVHLTDEDTVWKEKRGGRPEKLQEEEDKKRKDVRYQSFPKNGVTLHSARFQARLFTPKSQ